MENKSGNNPFMGEKLEKLFIKSTRHDRIIRENNIQNTKKKMEMISQIVNKCGNRYDFQNLIYLKLQVIDQTCMVLSGGANSKNRYIYDIPEQNIVRDFCELFSIDEQQIVEKDHSFREMMTMLTVVGLHIKHLHITMKSFHLVQIWEWNDAARFYFSEGINVDLMELYVKGKLGYFGKQRKFESLHHLLSSFPIRSDGGCGLPQKQTTITDAINETNQWIIRTKRLIEMMILDFADAVSSQPQSESGGSSERHFEAEAQLADRAA